jgi:hypothetical protein
MVFCPRPRRGDRRLRARRLPAPDAAQALVCAARGRDQMSAHSAQTSSGTSPARISSAKILQPRQ